MLAVRGSYMNTRDGEKRNHSPLKGRSTVATLDCAGLLGHLVEGEHATRGLHLANLVRLGGVRMTAAVSETLNHYNCRTQRGKK